MSQSLSDADHVVRLTITGDPDDSGSVQDGVFEFASGDEQTPLTATEELRTETRAFGGTPLTIFSDITGIDLGTENKDIALDFGNSTFATTLSGIVTADQRKPDGTQCQWGDTGDDSELTATDATGAHPAYKMTVLGEWLKNTRQSSVNELLGQEGGGPATVEYLSRREGGVHDPMEVVLESPSVTLSGGSPTVADLDMTVVEVANLENPIDALANDGR